mmetsp:Transcript_31559/g.100623  ORF Transcript_31559/g.100623 Transcript_31559/m.100623 type:complete len:235 (-) Transcript_31559:1659-2363(-)
MLCSVSSQTPNIASLFTRGSFLVSECSAIASSGGVEEFEPRAECHAREFTEVSPPSHDMVVRGWRRDRGSLTSESLTRRLICSTSLKSTSSRTRSSFSMAAVKCCMNALEYRVSKSRLSTNSKATVLKASASSSTRSEPPGAATKWPSHTARSAQSAASQAHWPCSTLGQSCSSSSASKRWYSRTPATTKIILLMVCSLPLASPSNFRSFPELREVSTSAFLQTRFSAAGQMRK